MITKGLFEQHFHGCFGIDFNKANVDEVIFLAKEMFKRGITTIIPVIATDKLENMSKQIRVIEQAKTMLDESCSDIFGIHLEGPFLNPQKKGAHPENLLKIPSVELYKQYLDSPLIKIVTLAIELDENLELVNYLKSKNIKISVGHSVAADLNVSNQVTHLFNAMNGLHHRNKTTSLSALTSDDLYVELIADGEHVQDDMLKLTFKVKNSDKILLISDCAPSAKSNLKEFEFLGSKIYLQGDKLVSKDGTIAGSSLLLDDIVRRLVKNNILTFDEAIKFSSTNQRIYHGYNDNSQIEWDENLNIKKIQRV